jgi:hypothetical protein
MCNIRPNLPHLTVLELMRKLINFPRPEICKHSVVCDLLSALEAEGMPVSEDLAGAVVNADDEGSLAILDKAIENCKKELEFVDWAAYGGV